MSPRGNAKPANGNGVGAGSVLADRYRLEERVAGGGMGEVWRATDLLLQRSVAVKLLRESLAEDPVVAERFKREALMAAQLSHPNMAGVFDYVQDNGRPCIVMEFVDGETLAERLARAGRLDVVEAVRIASGLLSALRSAHDAGIVHRDVKPGNVMLAAKGDVKVTDFGIARAASDHTLTETGMVIGTAHYLAPEQVSGRPATPSSDLYSVGAILYEMLAGRKPFEAETPIAVAMKRLTEDPAPLRTVRGDVPAPVAQVIERALARDPAERYTSAEEMRRALEGAFAASQPATAPQTIAPTPTEILPIADALPPNAAETVAVRPAALAPQPPPKTGESLPAAVAERRRREYRRLIVILGLLAVGVATAVILVLALVGGGTDVVAVPTFVGHTYTDATAMARRAGLTVVDDERPSRRAAGTVFGQDIRAGTQVVQGAQVTLIVSNGTPPAAGTPVPDVREKKQDEATRTLKDAGFTVKVTYVQAGGVDPGSVVGQNPGPNDTAQPGQQVAIVVATSPPKGHGKHKGGEG